MKNILLYPTIITLSVLSFLSHRDYTKRQDKLLEIDLEDKRNKEDKKEFFIYNNKVYIIRPLTQKEKEEYNNYIENEIKKEKKLNKIIDDLENKIEKEQERKNKKDKLEKEIEELKQRGGLSNRIKMWFKSFSL